LKKAKFLLVQGEKNGGDGTGGEVPVLQGQVYWSERAERRRQFGSHPYWSATTHASFPDVALDVDFAGGIVGPRTKTLFTYVRAVGAACDRSFGYLLI
jgi:hypothetical protein